MVAPATEQIAEQFGIHSSVIIAMTTSIFVIGYGKFPCAPSALTVVDDRFRQLLVRYFSGRYPRYMEGKPDPEKLKNQT